MKVGPRAIAALAPAARYVTHGATRGFQTYLCFKCDGYALSDSPDHPPGTEGASRTSLADKLELNFPTPSPGTTERERRGFTHFRARTALELAGFADLHHFWDIIIPRTTQYEPVIHHAVLALSALHERFKGEDPGLNRPWGKDDDNFALQQYNKAIQHLVKPSRSEQASVDVCLIACMLFACIEVRSIPNHARY